jgi:hypothetical protein
MPNEFINDLTKQMETDRTDRAEAKRRESEADNALPFLERTRWKKRFMYRGWTEEKRIRDVGDSAAITRSHYWYQVLNTPLMGFVDIDFNFWSDFGPYADLGETLDSIKYQLLDVLEKVKEWVANHPNQCWRVYRTAHGCRLIRTDAPQPLDADFDALCELVGADDLYRRLCHEQHCYRARITPKPIRVGVTMPYWTPYDHGGDGFGDQDRTTFPARVQEYEDAAAKYKTCKLIETVGSGIIHPDFLGLLDYHDQSCKVASTLPCEPLHSSELDTFLWRDIVEFNAVYRKDNWTPDVIWSLLSDEVRRALKHASSPETLASIKAENRRMKTLIAKWDAINKRTELDRHETRDAKFPLETSGATQKVEYCFSRDDYAGNLEGLSFALHELGYVETVAAPNNLGVSIDMVIDAAHVKEAREQLCDLAAKHGCTFDFWQIVTAPRDLQAVLVELEVEEIAANATLNLRNT